MSAFHTKNEEKGLEIMIVGCGKVGRTLVSRLSDEGHNITVVDKRPEVIQGMCETHDVLGIIGNGASFNVQLEAGIENTDLLIAVTDSDELNLLCCTVAKKVGNEIATIARVRNPDYSADRYYIREQLGLSMIINPELEAANEMARLLRFPGAISINAFAKGHVEMIKFKVPEKNVLDGCALYQLQTEQVLICAVERDEELVIPNGSFTLQAGDLVTFIATVTNAHKFFRHIGLKNHRVSNSMLIGGGKTSYYLAKQLLEMGIDVKIVEMDMHRCEILSELLDDAIIVCGDGTDEQLLAKEGIDRYESFVALTGMDEENILLTLHAKQNPTTKVITKVNRINFGNVLESLELGSVIYPKYITAETIIAYVRAKHNSMGSNIETLYHVFDDRAEAIEFRITQESEVVGVPLKNLKMKKNLLIACISRKGKVMIPGGNDEIQIGDTVIVVTMQTGFNEIDDVLEA
ncbi:MAG: Trk system potassium transporter TrkA [Clostridia bacterium]|nr:Trk system potassium transporter TrkA [Clostridia bacterium]